MADTKTDLTVSRTILEQLGGTRFVRFTGARDFIGSAFGLTFRLPGAGGFTKRGINHVNIRLNAFDTYDIDFSRVRGVKVTAIAYKEGVYAEDLRRVFTAETGLEVSFGQVQK